MFFKSIQLVLAFVFILSSVLSFAQESKWQADLSDLLVEVGWIEQSNDGLIIAAGAKGMVALNNNTGKTVWQNKTLKSVLKSSYKNIDGLPLFYAEYTPLGQKTRGIIVNSSTGDILYDSKDDNYRIQTYHLLPKRKMILFEMTKEKRQLLMSFSLETLQKTWIVDLGETSGIISKIASKISRLSFVDYGPIFTKADDMLIAIFGGVYCINQENGKIIWEQKTDQHINALVYSPLNNSVYMGIKKKLTVFDPKTGKDITPGKLKLKGTLVDVTSDRNNNIILVETTGFNLIDPKTNDFVWKKRFLIEYLDEVIPTAKGYIAIGKDEKDGSIAYVDKDGKKIWKEKLKGYVYYATTTPKGILYISTERSNIVNYDDGKDLWKKDVKFKSIPAVTYDEEEGKVVVFENGNGFKFDLKTGEMKPFAEDVELVKVNKKTPLVAEYRPEGYLLTTSQHISLLDKKGTVTYTNHYPELTSLNWTALAQYGLGAVGIDVDIAGSMENIKKLERLSRGLTEESNVAKDGTSTTGVVAGWYTKKASGEYVTNFEVSQTRYFNSKESKTHKYIVTRSEAGDKAILMINKSTGKVEKQIQLKEKQPFYVVDEIDNRVFLLEKGKDVVCFQM